MTSKAMEVLSKDKDGFFLMVEESKIDWAAHANDPVGVISDILAFDNAVKAALDFAKKDKQTVLLLIARLLRPWGRRAILSARNTSRSCFHLILRHFPGQYYGEVRTANPFSW